MEWFFEMADCSVLLLNLKNLYLGLAVVEISIIETFTYYAIATALHALQDLKN